MTTAGSIVHQDIDTSQLRLGQLDDASYIFIYGYIADGDKGLANSYLFD